MIGFCIQDVAINSVMVHAFCIQKVANLVLGISRKERETFLSESLKSHCQAHLGNAEIDEPVV